MAVTRRRWTSLLVACSAASTMMLGCDDPYDGWGDPEGEFYAGPLDPINFPAAYRGAGADRFFQGTGSFVAANANVGGQSVDYFAFPFTDAQLASPDPLRLLTNGNPAAWAPTPLAYVFDPRAESPFPEQRGCAVEEGYEYDAYRDGIRYDEQGNIFTEIPNATFVPGSAPVSTYIPVVRQVPVASNGLRCQSAKSVDNLLARNDVSFETVELPGGKKEGKPDGRFLAWAVIDPGAGVYRSTDGDDATGIGLQRWGWYGHYLLAYIDGGYIPTAEGVAGNNATPILSAVPQRIYVPRSPIVVETEDGPGERTFLVGEGLDVLQQRRGQPGYSPVCQVMTYDMGSAQPPTAVPDNEAAILAAYSDTLRTGGAEGDGNPPYIYCLQPE